MKPACLPALLLIAAAPAGPASGGGVTAVIEIPAGSDIKYERDAQGRLFVDRFLALPVHYPVNYGVVDGTRAGDGDELDVLVHTRTPVMPGARIRVRPVGVLRMTDAGQADHKIVAVPADSVDPAYARVETVTDLPAADVARIADFFRLYKQAPDGASPVVLSGFGDADEAADIIRVASAQPR
ncbi:inorganic diphosphatase [Sphingosinicella soli]|uniref:Inorganic pyrophosphatase n=1 Tax=Sphingosinicella soli TaxID=333708 RepID=A0A7W7F5Q9_9SPHN|nr:inorganic diphosphatase [Sphingosinicella soli]MBB4630802.1 inorganic pyrophosphatase [Sphingosinicella soli]